MPGGEIIVLALPYTATFNQWVYVHGIGGGQAGFDGMQLNVGIIAPGGQGGKGADYARSNAIFLRVGDTISGTIGVGGFPNGAAGTDTELYINGGFFLRAKGGNSPNPSYGAVIAAGGTPRPRHLLNVAFPPGRGGSGGCGAGGPNGVGATNGDLNAKIINTFDALTNTDGGTGGGAANGGDPGCGQAELGNFHITEPAAPNFTLQYVPGDGGDGGTTSPTWLVSLGSPYPNFGGLAGASQGAIWGSGGKSGQAEAHPGKFNGVSDTGITNPPAPFAGFRGQPYYSFQTFPSGGGFGFTWGNVPNWATTPPVYIVGSSAGPGGGGGGGLGGNQSSGIYTFAGGGGGQYGGGGGGGGNWELGSVITDGIGGRGGNGVVALEAIATPIIRQEVFAPVYPPIRLPSRWFMKGPTRGNL